MRLRILCLALSLACGLVGIAAADESGNFVVRLGRDTTGVEHFTRTNAGVEVQQVGRSPRVLQRRFFYDMGADGVIRKFSLTVTNPADAAGAPPVQQVDATFSSDSMRMDIKRGPDVSTQRVAMAPGTVLLTGSSSWEMYEGLSLRLAAQKADSLRRPAWYAGGSAPVWVAVRRLGRDSIVIQTQFDLYHAQIDKAGHLLHVRPIRGTAQYTVDRVPTLDLAAYTASFSAGERAAGAMGALSTRDTVSATAGGAALWIDYGRPAKRDRVIFGGLVPWNLVWRTGANAATQFRTDKALQMNGTTVPAGFYTLWSIPTPTGMKLVINSQTGQWGTDHDPAKDLYTIDMQVSPLPQPVERFTITLAPSGTGGVLNLDWDTRRASLPFTTAPQTAGSTK
jgi:hypothetical protein